MNGRKLLTFGCWLLAAAVLAWSFGTASAAQTTKVTRDEVAKKLGKVTPSEQKAAVKKNQQMGLRSGVAGLHCSRHPRPWRGTALLRPLRQLGFQPAAEGSHRNHHGDAGGTGYTAPTVTIEDAYLRQA